MSRSASTSSANLAARSLAKSSGRTLIGGTCVGRENVSHGSLQEFVDMAKTALFSRSGNSCILGKCTAELPKVRIPDETLEILNRNARGAGMTLVEYLRWKALIDAHGFDFVNKMQQDRLRVIAGNGELKGG